MEILKNIYRNMEYPISFSLNSYTKKIHVVWRKDEWTEQMQCVLPSISVKIITDNNTSTLVLDSSNYYANTLIDSNYVLQIQPNWDKYAIRNHNEMVTNGIINDTLWYDDINLYPCSIEIYDLDNGLTTDDVYKELSNHIDKRSINMNTRSELYVNIDKKTIQENILGKLYVAPGYVNYFSKSGIDGTLSYQKAFKLTTNGRITIADDLVYMNDISLNDKINELNERITNLEAIIDNGENLLPSLP